MHSFLSNSVMPRWKVVSRIVPVIAYVDLVDQKKLVDKSYHDNELHHPYEGREILRRREDEQANE